MSELNGPKISVNQVSYKGIQKQTPQIEQESKNENPQITDFSDSKAEALGRSMLIKGSEDSVNNDLKALLDNPQIAENSDVVFEAAYAAAQNSGMANPYEEAASASTVSM